jgi:predicted methyltransferase
MTGPLLTLKVNQALLAAAGTIECSLDLERSRTTVEVDKDGWVWQNHRFPYVSNAKERTIYYWVGEQFQPVSRYSGSLIKLVPTDWGPPTFEIDGIKMLPTERVSPYADAERKVGLIQPQGKAILDTCGGLGYFAAACLHGRCARVQSFERNADVIWLRGINPWSPAADPRLTLAQADVAQEIAALPSAVFDAALHDPPRFGIAGELYSQVFYDHLARVLKPRGKLFHYTGTPNKLTSGRDVPNEVATRLRKAGFTTEINGDGVLAVKKRNVDHLGNA